MLLVKTHIGPSAIEGLGLFTDEFIPKGAPVWKFTPGFDLEVPADRLATLSMAAREQFLKYAYLSVGLGLYVLCFDDARFFNHSDMANCINAGDPEYQDGMTVAARDIEKGEELTCDYRSFDADFGRKMAGLT